jgi:hypothetical protein
MTQIHKIKTRRLKPTGPYIRFIRGTRNKVRVSLWITPKRLRSGYRASGVDFLFHRHPND